MTVPTYSQLQGSPGNALAIMVSGTNPDGTSFELPVSSGPVSSTNILSGFQTFTATTGATTVITVPAGRTWVGTITMTCAAAEVAAGTVAATATGTVTTAGTGVTPSAGTYFKCSAVAGANAASGLVGDASANSLSSPFVVVAPAGNSVTIQATSTNAGTFSEVNVSVIGALQ